MKSMGASKKWDRLWVPTSFKRTRDIIAGDCRMSKKETSRVIGKYVEDNYPVFKNYVEKEKKKEKEKGFFERSKNAKDPEENNLFKKIRF